MSAQTGISLDLRAADLGAALLRPVRAHHAFESCVEQLATAIRLGGYPQGEALPPERELAALLGVSRATIREAMVALRAAGLVETRRGRGGGTVVLQPPEQPGRGTQRRVDALPRAQMIDALLFRRVVEPGAAHAAAERRSDGVLDDEAMAALQAALDEVTGTRDPAQHRQRDSRFHLAVARASGSTKLLTAVTEVQRSLHEMLMAIPVLAPNLGHSDGQHGAVLKAIAAGNPLRARRVMEEHCDDTAALLRGLIG
ncbi:MAG: FCD domain-containing protein [Nakamurella sp.]